MLKLDTNAVIITRDVIWLKKIYWEYMGMTNMMKYNIEEDKEDGYPYVKTVENNNEKETEKETEPADDENTTPNQPKNERKIPLWQKNLQTFYNPVGREDNDELGKIAFLSMLEGSVNEPRFFHETWNHPELNERKSWQKANKNILI